MTELFMSGSVWRERATEIAANVDLLHKNPASLRRFTLAAIYEVATGELLARIVDTNDGIVAVGYWWTPEGVLELRERILSGEDCGINRFRKTDQLQAVIPLAGRLDRLIPLSSRARAELYFVAEEDILRRVGRVPYGDGVEFSREPGLTFG